MSSQRVHREVKSSEVERCRKDSRGLGEGRAPRSRRSGQVVRFGRAACFRYRGRLGGWSGEKSLVEREEDRMTEELTLMRGDARVNELRVVVDESMERSAGGSTGKEDWLKLVRVETGVLDEAPSEAAGGKFTVSWPSRATCECLQNFLAAVSLVNGETGTGGASGDAPEPKGAAVTLACWTASQREDLVSWVSKDTMAPMGVAVLGPTKAEKKMCQCVETIQGAIKEALQKQSSVEDAVLQVRMEKLSKVISRQACPVLESFG